MRVRPLSEREREAGGHKCVQQPSAHSVRVLTSEPQVYTFDAVAGEAADQAAFFRGARAATPDETLIAIVLHRDAVARAYLNR